MAHGGQPAPVYVAGRLTQSTREDQKSGQKRTKTKVTGHRVEGLSWPEEDASGTALAT